MIEPVTISVPESILDDLKERLVRTRWPAQIARAPWSEGADLGFLRNLADHWLSRFDWRAEERAINALPHFSVAIDGLPIHFVRVEGRGRLRLPLLLSNGWRSSFLEYRRIMPLLTDPLSFGGDPEYSFDVVIPSLPGYGMSPAPTRPGTDPRVIAHLFDRLMTEVLGVARYGAHGSDIGASVVSQ
jgi:pimeloyl-ACP methyl ester carboxylesterase